MQRYPYNIALHRVADTIATRHLQLAQCLCELARDPIDKCLPTLYILSRKCGVTGLFDNTVIHTIFSTADHERLFKANPEVYSAILRLQPTTPTHGLKS